jgi:hypothetical protein
MANAATQFTMRVANAGTSVAAEEAVDAELDIDREFRRKLASLRRLPARDRIHALRAAKDARRQALNALRERRRTARYAKHRARLEQKPAPC